MSYITVTTHTRPAQHNSPGNSNDSPHSISIVIGYANSTSRLNSKFEIQISILLIKFLPFFHVIIREKMLGYFLTSYPQVYLSERVFIRNILFYQPFKVKVMWNEPEPHSS